MALAGCTTNPMVRKTLLTWIDWLYYSCDVVLANTQAQTVFEQRKIALRHRGRGYSAHLDPRFDQLHISKAQMIVF